MFNIFKKKENELPEFEELSRSKNKDMYFARAATWDWFNNELINVVDRMQPRVITMDPWPQEIFLEADGQQTISQFVFTMAGKYGRGTPIPKELDKTILSGISQLINLNIITLSREKRELPYYLDKPIKEQNLEISKRLMLEDGFITE